METKQYNSLFSFIWNIANDVLVHAFEKGDYKKIILPFMVLRRIDVLLEPTKEKVLAKKEFCDKNGIVERILIVADKFQTGYDQPLLHTMYVDKMHIFYSLLVKKLPKLRMDDDTVDVVINKEALSDKELAQITDIVTRKTGCKKNALRISLLKKDTTQK